MIFMRKKFVLSLAYISCTILLSCSSAQGALVIINSLGDQPAAHPAVSPLTAVGTITLRSSIQFANSNTDTENMVHFSDLSGEPPFTIKPHTNLDPITKKIIIDGYTAPHAHPNTNVIGNNARITVRIKGPGSKLPTVESGLTLDLGSDASQIRGLAIDNFLGDGFTTFGASITVNSDNTLIAGNFIGIDTSGKHPKPIVQGIVLMGNSNRVGTPEPKDRNLFAGTILGQSLSGGVVVMGNGAVIRNNYFGTDRTGTRFVTNDIGIALFGQKAVVGGDLTINELNGNLINAGMYGIEIFTGTQSHVEGNLIGTNINGTKTLSPKAGIGIALYDGANDSTIINNVISAFTKGIETGNGFFGIPVLNTRIRSNLIGTDRTGTKPLGNARYGITIINGFNTEIGGNTNRGNIIASSGIYGIFVGDNASNNTINGNMIGTDIAGLHALANKGDGIHVGTALSVKNDNTLIGAEEDDRSNVISGNRGNGIALSALTFANRIRNNRIGEALDGNSLPNARNGILIQCSFNNTIG